MAPPRKHPELSNKERDLFRKQQHSLIEKNRRTKFNKLMLELKQLVPKSRNQGSLNQLCILKNACEFIKSVRENISGNDLMCENKQLIDWSPPSPAKSNQDEFTKPIKKNEEEYPMRIHSLLS
jgi:hypothetical protein